MTATPTAANPARLAIALSAFFAAVVVAATVIVSLDRQRLQMLRAQLAADGIRAAAAIEARLEGALSATRMLGALLEEGNGLLPDFERLADEIIPWFPAIDSLQLAPLGVVRRIHPLAGNEQAIGHDLLLDPARNREAFDARRSGKPTLAGPFRLIQGGAGLALRLPIYLGDADADVTTANGFWGFTIALVRLPRLLEAAGLERFEQRGHQYQIVAIDKHQRTSPVAGAALPATVRTVDADIRFANAHWRLRVVPEAGWQDTGRLVRHSLIGLLLSALAGVLAWLAATACRRPDTVTVVPGQPNHHTVDERNGDDSDGDRRFRDIVEASADWIWEVDTEGRYTFTSDSVTTLLGYRPEELIGRTAFDIMPSGEADRVGGEFRRIVESREKFRDLYNVVLDKQGKRHDTLTSGAPILDTGGNLVGYRGVDRDITGQKDAERRMREAMVVFNASSQGILTTDAAGVIRSVNPAFTEITGFRATDAIGRTPAFLKSGRHQPEFYRELWRQLKESGCWEGEIWNRRNNGEIFPEWLTITRVLDEDGEVAVYVGLFSDITRRKQQEYAIWRQANFDALTGLANRELQYDRLDQAIVHARRTGARVGLIFIDLDDFKTINDTLGHEVGDRVLVDVAQRLQRVVRAQDTVSRFGGDEFTIIVEDANRIEHIKRVGAKVVATLDDPFMLDNHTYYLSGSAGIAIFPEDGADVPTLMRHADIAMYSAKRSGKRRVCYFDNNMQQEADRSMRLESDLRRALHEEGFDLVFQPIVDAADGKVVGAEALLRWEHPEHGPIEPGRFVPIAEQCGLIVELGGWVIERALDAQSQWKESLGIDVPISVNVSGMQFRERGFNDAIGRALERHPGADLTLEVTESVLTNAPELLLETMQDLRTQGVGFALDGFGQGFSSISYLRRFPLQYVKIDREFISDYPGDQGDARLVEAIIGAAKSLDLKVVAIGVDDPAQLKALRVLGCDQIQGYLAGRPASADAFGQILQAGPLI